MRWLSALVAVALAAPSPTGDPSELGPERVVFHTVAGDLVFALYPNAAPNTVAQFLRLARTGVYDTTAFTQVKPGFVAMVSMAINRRTPLTQEQSALLHKLPLEPSSLRHVRGALSLNHPIADPDGGESSFCVMLGPAPQLDGKYTVFGTLVAGDGVLAELAAVPRGPAGTPTVRLTINRAEVFDTPQALSQAPLAPAHPVRGAAPVPRAQPPPNEGLLLSGLLLVALLSGVNGLFQKRFPRRLSAAVSLVVLLVSSFLLMVLLLPRGPRSPWISALLFFWLIGVFRALGRFEPANDSP